MKAFLIIVLSSITIKCIGQIKQSEILSSPDTTNFKITHTDNSKKDWPLAVYVNSSLIFQTLPCMDPNDVATIKIIKGKDSINKTSGTVSIELKKKGIHFIAINELTQKCIPGYDATKQPVAYVIDDKFINDASDIAFETSYIRNIEVLDYSKDTHHIGPISNLVVIKIYTKSAAVYIKGEPDKASLIK